MKTKIQLSCVEERELDTDDYYEYEPAGEKTVGQCIKIMLDEESVFDFLGEGPTAVYDIVEVKEEDEDEDGEKE